MPTIRPCEVPANSFLRQYKDGAGYADCYVADVAGSVSQAAFVEAFYTSGLFKLERALFTVVASRPANDQDAQRLASGAVSQFSAWYVEAQSPTELLLKDMTGRTRSWLMALPDPDASTPPRTHLYFGSAVVPKLHADGKPGRMGWAFHALLGFHRLYSHMLLGASSRRVRPD